MKQISKCWDERRSKAKILHLLALMTFAVIRNTRGWFLQFFGNYFNLYFIKGIVINASKKNINYIFSVHGFTNLFYFSGKLVAGEGSVAFCLSNQYKYYGHNFAQYNEGKDWLIA